MTDIAMPETALTDDTLLRRSDDAADSRVGDETVILHLGSGTYFGLDPVGSRIWDLLSEPATPASIQARMLEEFAVEPDILRADMQAFLGNLIAHDIIRPA